MAAISPSTSSAPMAMLVAVQPSGALTLSGPESSTSTRVPEWPTKATMPRAMRAPKPPHLGHCTVPTRSICVRGIFARPT